MTGAPKDSLLLNELLELRRQGGPLARITEGELREFESDLEEVRCAEGEILIEPGEAIDRA